MYSEAKLYLGVVSWGAYFIYHFNAAPTIYGIIKNKSWQLSFIFPEITGQNHGVFLNLKGDFFLFANYFILTTMKRNLWIIKSKVIEI